MPAGSATIALRVTARRIAVIRQDRAARGRGQVVGHLDRAKALAGTELTPAILQRLSPGEAMQAHIALDRGGTVLFWSPSAEWLFGYGSPEAVGRSIVDLVVPPQCVAETSSSLPTIVKLSP